MNFLFICAVPQRQVRLLFSHEKSNQKSANDAFDPKGSFDSPLTNLVIVCTDLSLQIISSCAGKISVILGCAYQGFISDLLTPQRLGGCPLPFRKHLPPKTHSSLWGSVRLQRTLWSFRLNVISSNGGEQW